jgi:hypothetical protein
MPHAKPAGRGKGGGTKGLAPTISDLFSQPDLHELTRQLGDAANGWVVPFQPEQSPLLVDLARGGRAMGTV